MGLVSADVLFNGGLIAYLAGAAAGLACIRRPGAARLLAFGMSLVGALLEIAASFATLTQGATATWNLPCGVALFSWTVRLDPLSAFFSLALGLVAAAVSVYSWGYMQKGEARRGVGLLGFFYNVLLLSLTLVFTASNAFFFLLVWEVMALSAYCLVSFEHEKKETRKAGTLFLIMSHAGTGMLLIAFLVLATCGWKPGFLELPPVGLPADAASSGSGLRAVLPGIRRQGGDHSHAHLAARRSPGGAEQHLRPDVGHRHQGGNLRHGARFLRLLRRATAVGRNPGSGRGRQSRHC